MIESSPMFEKFMELGRVDAGLADWVRAIKVIGEHLNKHPKCYKETLERKVEDLVGRGTDATVFFVCGAFAKAPSVFLYSQKMGVLLVWFEALRCCVDLGRVRPGTFKIRPCHQSMLEYTRMAQDRRSGGPADRWAEPLEMLLIGRFTNDDAVAKIGDLLANIHKTGTPVEITLAKELLQQNYGSAILPAP